MPINNRGDEIVFQYGTNRALFTRDATLDSTLLAANANKTFLVTYADGTPAAATRITVINSSGQPARIRLYVLKTGYGIPAGVTLNAFIASIGGGTQTNVTNAPETIWLEGVEAPANDFYLAPSDPPLIFRVRAIMITETNVGTATQAAPGVRYIAELEPTRS